MPKSSPIKNTRDDQKESREWKRVKREEKNRVIKEIEKEEYEELLSDRRGDDHQQ